MVGEEGEHLGQDEAPDAAAVQTDDPQPPGAGFAALGSLKSPAAEKLVENVPAPLMNLAVGGEGGRLELFCVRCQGGWPAGTDPV